MATEKTPNYTEAQTEKLVAAYKAAGTDQTEAGQQARKAVVVAFAKEFDKNEKSIVAKLTREGCYLKNERLTKTGEKVEKKDSTASAIGAILGLDEASIDSLCKANKKALSAIFTALANSKPLESGEFPEIQQ